jgi:hypothetical protein
MPIKNVWWCAIDTKYCSYLELKHRHVIAQGWPYLGDLSTLAHQFSYWRRNKDDFCKIIQLLGDASYEGKDWWNVDRQQGRAPTVIWNLMNIEKNDLVVGIEGRTVKGICQIKPKAAESYRHDAPEVFDYANTVGFPVQWIDWEPTVFGFTPVAPQLGVLGIRHVVGEKQKVIDAWEKYQASKSVQGE